MKNNNKLDKFLYKIISRKLMVFLLGTVFFSLGMVAAEQWLILATAYVSLQTFSDTIFKIKGGFQSDELNRKIENVKQAVKKEIGIEDD